MGFGSRPTRTVPAGCVVGLFALLALVFAAIGLVGLVRWWAQPAPGRDFDATFGWLAVAAGGGLVVAAALARWAVRIHRATDFRSYDPDDPRGGMMKW